jgi:hypothetical protein
MLALDRPAASPLRPQRRGGAKQGCRWCGQPPARRRRRRRRVGCQAAAAAAAAAVAGSDLQPGRLRQQPLRPPLRAHDAEVGALVTLARVPQLETVQAFSSSIS